MEQSAQINMDLMEIACRALEASLPLTYEADSVNPFVFTSQGQDGFLKLNVINQRRQMASELLEVLESAQADLDEPYSGWLEEPMDLEVFGQSLEQSSGLPLDEVQAPYESFGPSSPPGSEPLTPLAPSSPQELYAAQDDLIDIKFDTAIAVPDNEELMESLESLLNQFESNASSTASSSTASPEPSEEDVAAAFLESLLTESVEENQLIDELAKISEALLPSTEQSQTPEPQAIEQTPMILMPTVVLDMDNSFDSESTTSEETAPRRRGRKPRTATEASTPKPRGRIAKPEEKRLRKKEQNKTAATRYRMKKKAELELLLDEADQLEERNRELQATYDDLASEIRYLKKLFREVIAGGKRQ